MSSDEIRTRVIKPLHILWWLIFLAVQWAAVAQTNSEPRLITRVGDLVRLSPAEASKNHPVRLRAVTTCVVHSSQLLFIADETGGVYVMPAPWPQSLVAGDTVNVSGRSAPGRFSPIVQSATIEITGHQAILPPRRIALEELAFGRYDGQWIEVIGVVRRDQRGEGILELDLAQGSATARVLFFQEASLPELVDSRVRVRGVAGTFYDQEKLSGFGIFLPNTNSLEVLEAPRADPFSAPLRPARRLFWFSPDGETDHRVRVQGTLTHVMGREGYVRDETGSVPILAEEPIVANPGVKIEAVGFLDGSPEPRRLTQVRYRILGTGELPPKRRLEQHRDWGPLQKELVQAEGMVAARASEAAQNTYVIQGPNLAVAVTVPASLQLAEGARVRVSGILQPTAKGDSGTWPTILASAAGVEVLAPPEPAASGGVSRGVVALGFGIGGVSLVFALLLLGAMRGRLAKLGRERSGFETQVQDLRGQLDHSQHERERLGRDLHDHTIQSIYALGLRIDECATTVEQQPAQARNRLQGALADVNRIIRELRSVIMGLESSLIRPQEFRTAIKSLALALGNERSPAIRLDLEQTGIDRLTATEATELVHLTREALSNTIRHAEAQSATVELHQHDGVMRFSVEDDGKGFDTSQPTRPEGLGLRNMARRAERLQARFAVTSAPGRGTKIVLDIPRAKQHGS